MSVVLKFGAIAALGLAVSVTSVQAASLGLTTAGPVDSGTGDLNYFGPGTGGLAGFAFLAAGGSSNLFYDPADLFLSSFDSGAGTATIDAVGYVGEVLEFKLGAFDAYSSGALLKVDLTGSGLTGDPFAAIFSMTSFSASTAGYELQGLASVAAIPLPAGALLLGTALAGLGFARKRRSA